MEFSSGMLNKLLFTNDVFIGSHPYVSIDMEMCLQRKQIVTSEKT
jgi:hypothetical protein